MLLQHGGELIEDGLVIQRAFIINAPASRLKKSCRAVKSEFLSLIDAVIEAHGGWPGAFQGHAADADSEPVLKVAEGD